VTALSDKAMAELVVKIDNDDAPSGVHSPVAAFKVAEDYGLTLEAIHPESADPNLARWFHVSTSDTQKLQMIADVLRNVPGVSAAYIKPSAELP
jgi:hypothetical protein